MKKLIIGLLSLVFMLGMVRTALAYSFTDAQDVNDGTVGQLVVDVLVDMEVPNYIYVPAPPDTTSPVVNIALPTDSSILNGLADLVGSVTDNVKLSHYNFSLYPGTTDLSDGNTHSGDRLNDSRWCTTSISGTVNLSTDFTANFCEDWDQIKYTTKEWQKRRQDGLA